MREIELKSKGTGEEVGVGAGFAFGGGAVGLEEVRDEGLGQDAEARRFGVDVDRLFDR